MTFVCLTSLAGPPAAMGLGELGAALLDLVPRVKVEAPEGLPAAIWADTRGLPARAVAERLLVRLRGLGCERPRAGVARTPVAAGVAARQGQGKEPVTEVPPGEDREFLAPRPVAVLAPSDELARLFRGTGVERCRDLARLDQASVEVVYGAEGVMLWRLARADDPRIVFSPMPRELPHASLEWTDYVLRDPEQLLFIVNRLATTVCAALYELGQGARGFTLVFDLASGGTVEQPFHPSRPNANPRTWLRLARSELERVRLPDAVVGIHLRTDAVAPSERVQGDVLDRGFATAKVAEEALARILDQGSTLVTPDNSRHPLVTRRTRWLERPPSLVWARPQLRAEDTTPQLALHLFAEPETVEVDTAPRRGFRAPLRYRAKDGRHDLVSASGPDCVSGGQWDEGYAYELYCCVRLDGEIVLLCRNAAEDAWQVAGVWR